MPKLSMDELDKQFADQGEAPVPVTFAPAAAPDGSIQLAPQAALESMASSLGVAPPPPRALPSITLKRGVSRDDVMKFMGIQKRGEDGLNPRPAIAEAVQVQLAGAAVSVAPAPALAELVPGGVAESRNDDERLDATSGSSNSNQLVSPDPTSSSSLERRVDARPAEPPLAPAPDPALDLGDSTGESVVLASVQGARGVVADAGASNAEELLVNADPGGPRLQYLGGPAGCLTGSTAVQYNRGLRNSGRYLTLAELYQKFNGLGKPRPGEWDSSIPTFLHSLGDDGVMFYNKIVAVYQSGIKPLVRVGLFGESWLRATADHPIMTPNGFVPAGLLKPDDVVLCRGSMLARSQGGRDLSARPPRVIVNLRHHPYGAFKEVSGYEYTRVARARLVVEAHLNGVPYDEFVHALKHNAELAAAFRYIPTDFEVHHDDENTLNDDIGNLVVLSKAEHARLHNQRGNFNFDSVREVPVVSTEEVPEEMTYDVQMEAPANNFCANGIVVHNTGKTFAIKLAAEADPRIVLCATTGVAACNLGERVTTINSLLMYFDLESLKDRWTTGFLERRLSMLHASGCRRIVLDEVSMMDGRQLAVILNGLEIVNEAVGAAEPLMLTLTGDFCLAYGTPVMMASGELRAVNAVGVGEYVMGPDSRPRRVLALVRGQSALYKVKQTNGDDYTTTGNHRVMLRRSVDGQRRDWINMRYPATPELFSLSVAELARKSLKFRECFVGYKAGLVHLEHRPVDIEPYFLGVWLGDGDSDSARITSMDPEIIAYCSDYARRLGLRVHTNYWARTKAVRVGIRKTTRGNTPNPLWEFFHGHRLPCNKHIPAAYLYNDEATRLQLLAGLLDTDGCWSGNRYVITLAVENLARDIKQLADQLGFRASLYETRCPGGKLGRQWTVGIGGDTWRIPCRVARKQSKPRPLGRSRMTSVLSVEPAGYGDYYGFVLSGDRQFLLGDGTVTHNCQLPPVDAGPARIDRRTKRPKGGGCFAFEIPQWQNFETKLLSNIRRQADPRFILALREARRGNGLGASNILAPQCTSVVDEDFNGTTLVAKNDAVDGFNMKRMLKLSGPDLTYQAALWGEPRSEWKNIPMELELRKGALVMVLANCSKKSLGIDEPGYEYVNGDLGIFVEQGPGGHTASVKLHRTGETISVYNVTRQNLQPVDNARMKWLRANTLEKIKDNYEIKGELTYMPLRAAWASTVNKAQGLSLDAVQVDLRDGFFHTGGMAYVALTRCRTLEGLKIVGSPALLKARCNVDSRVRRWL